MRVEERCMKSDKGPQVLPLMLFNVIYYPVRLQPTVFLLVGEDISPLHDGGSFGLIYARYFFFTQRCVFLHHDSGVTAVWTHLYTRNCETY